MRSFRSSGPGCVESATKDLGVVHPGSSESFMNVQALNKASSRVQDSKFESLTGLMRKRSNFERHARCSVETQACPAACKVASFTDSHQHPGTNSLQLLSHSPDEADEGS